MANPAWGTKRVCQSCGTIYYDMKKNPPSCPSCTTKFDPEALLRSRRGRSLPEETKVVAEETPKDELEILNDAALEDEDLLEGDDEEEDALIEDASELGGEDDDAVIVPVPGDDR